MKLIDFATTPTQKRVAEKADQGKARQEIADELDTSLRSVQRTLQRIKRNARNPLGPALNLLAGTL